MELICPKCRGVMRQYERSSVVIDQCTECRGIFLDRGELERLTDAENAWHRSHEAMPSAQPRVEYRDPRGTQYGGHYGHPKKRRKSFFEELFD